MSYNPFGGLDKAADAPQENYNDESWGARYPYLTWVGEPPSKDDWSPGHFITDADNFDKVPDYFTTYEKRKTPQSAPKTVARASIVPVCVIIPRMRKKITVGKKPNETVFYYPMNTPTEQMETGSFGTEHEAMIVLPNNPDKVFILSNKSYYKVLSFDNDPTRKNAKSGFPQGVQQLAEVFAAKATAWRRNNAGYDGVAMHWKCQFWLPLTALTEETGQAVYLDMGHNQIMNPYTLDVSAGQKVGLAGLYVGDDLVRQFNDIRNNIGKDWAAEWGEKSVQEISDSEDGYGDVPPSNIKEDDIPF